MFQSTHLHEVWHCRFALLLPKMPVSIHTPTWGVTCMSSIVCKFRSFQSTHLHEVWLCDRRSIRLYGAVSIHTPTWGVTLQTWIITQQEKSFQSTHLHEVWPTTTSGQPLPLKFQSTHLHEVWPNKQRTYTLPMCFNPHTYMRCDFISLWRYCSCKVSIHTPTWGVTIVLNKYHSYNMFQSTHLHEVWQQKLMKQAWEYVSIHTPTWGVTKKRRNKLWQS